jgi:Protein of unknown function (DUF3617)
MHIRRIALQFSAFGLALATLAGAQNRKAGLWEVTSTMTWQQSPFPSGMGHMGAGPHTTDVCVTQEQIDKYGTVPPQTRGSCQMTDIVKKDHGMSADMVCTGPMGGKGNLEATWTDDSHSTAKLHFLGAMKMGAESKPIEWTVDTSSVYKGPDCGDVKPIQTK